jgi:hypothetical protein
MIKIAYIGFSKIFGNNHKFSLHSGVAQSDFTYEILSENFNTTYFVCLDKKISKKIYYENIKSIVIKPNKFFFLWDAFLCAYRISTHKKFKYIVIYHSLLFGPLIILLKLIKLKVILQVNEVFYNDGIHNSLIFEFFEKLLFKIVDGFIFSTNELQKYIEINEKKKSSIPIIPGPINIPNFKNKIKNDIIKIVFAGVIDRNKVGGAFILLELAKKLNNSQYTIDFYGYADKKTLEEFLVELNNINFSSLTKVNYMGLLNQNDLIVKLSEYDIGIASQYIGTKFSLSSFPSKILTYLSAGLLTISATSPAVESWEFSKYIFIYRDPNLVDLIEFLNNIKDINNYKNESEINIIKIRKKISYDLKKYLL